MPHYVIGQPNGRFAIWSTVVDNFLAFNLTLDEVGWDLYETRLSLGAPDRAADVQAYVAQAAAAIAAHGVSAEHSYTWSEALETIAVLHGPDPDAWYGLQAAGLITTVEIEALLNDVASRRCPHCGDVLVSVVICDGHVPSCTNVHP